MQHADLKTWLHHLEDGVAGGRIELGLTRVRQVWQQMGLMPHCPVIIVGGTNGKGSVCAYLTQIYTEAGYQVGTLTSPHLLRFNERIAINGEPLSDAEIVTAFEQIEAARAEIPLSYFEFNALAAVERFIHHQVDVMILEVGMGGRFDAINIFDADVAVITNVGLDHQAYLGDTVEKIAYEKAAIMRPGRVAICGQKIPPHSLSQYAGSIGADLLSIDHDFCWQKPQPQQWSFQFQPQQGALVNERHACHALPVPVLRGGFQLNNAACALAVLECLRQRLPVDLGAIKRGLVRVCHKGRFQVLPGRPLTVLDVGHNGHAAHVLRASLIELPYAPRRVAVFSMLADKDIDRVLDIVKDQFDEWLIAPLPVPRGMDIAALQEKLAQHGIEKVRVYPDIPKAYQAALSSVDENDRIVVFGSFHTVAAVMALLP
ncbi:bifunctional tetrahydrofolate synthase/dihydrofolate synthase [Neisseriaceae bacterium ESL0693]|nr:bifunctional tetrahydrofolate synthase/dihydrofolate synthase [Neisseriaceae bacterium ESL0693]